MNVFLRIHISPYYFRIFQNHGVRTSPCYRAFFPVSVSVKILPSPSTADRYERFTEDTSDVSFVSADNKKLHLHKAILAVESPVFQKMCVEEVVSLAGTEVDWDAFCNAIALVYGKEVELSTDGLLEMYKVANTYDLASVKTAIIEGVPKIKQDDVIQLFLMVLKTERQMSIRKRMMHTCKDFLISHFDQLTDSDLNMIPFDVMCNILQSNDLKVESEVLLFEKAVSWIEANSECFGLSDANIQDLLGNIRYGTISHDDLINIVSGKICNREKFSGALKAYRQLGATMLWSDHVQFTRRKYHRPCLQVFQTLSDIGVKRTEKSMTYSDIFLGWGQYPTAVYQCSDSFKFSFDVQLHNPGPNFVPEKFFPKLDFHLVASHYSNNFSLPIDSKVDATTTCKVAIRGSNFQATTINSRHYFNNQPIGHVSEEIPFSQPYLIYISVFGPGTISQGHEHDKYKWPSRLPHGARQWPDASVTYKLINN